MSNINPARAEKISGHQANILRSYTRLPDGTVLAAGTAADDSVKISFEFSSPYQTSWKEFTWRNGFEKVSVFAPKNAMVNGGEGEIGVWEPAIDGAEGFNVEVELPRFITLSGISEDLPLDWTWEVQLGFYKILVPWDVGGDRILQEFEVSVRD